jgi:hypothetical protein
MNNIKILTKLHAIMSEVGYIQKDKKNAFHNYNYASEKAIKETLQPKLIEHKVLFQLGVVGQRIEGGLTLADFTYVFWDVESGESISGTFAGQGEDKLDKGIWKATTGAIKYILTSTFLIPTGDDPEENNPREKEPVGSDAKALAEYKIILSEFTNLAEYKKVGRDLIKDAIKSGVTKDDAEGFASVRVRELTNGTKELK